MSPVETEMPVLFVGHGNPMYAITENIFRNKWNNIGNEMTKPKAILCISAHWLTKNTYVFSTGDNNSG